MTDKGQQAVGIAGSTDEEVSAELCRVFVVASRHERDLLSALCQHLGFEQWTPPKRMTVKLAAELEGHLRRAGSNDIATALRGGHGVSYREVVLDVGDHLRADVEATDSVETNEIAVVAKVIGRTLQRMDATEASKLIRSLDPERRIPVGAMGTLTGQVLIEVLGGEAVRRAAYMAASSLARALLGRGLSVAASSALSRAVGLVFGPIGWAVTGAWLAVDIVGPAFRKTVPAVVTVAAMRQALLHRPAESGRDRGGVRV